MLLNSLRKDETWIRYSMGNWMIASTDSLSSDIFWWNGYFKTTSCSRFLFYVNGYIYYLPYILLKSDMLRIYLIFTSVTLLRTINFCNVSKNTNKKRKTLRELGPSFWTALLIQQKYVCTGCFPQGNLLHSVTRWTSACETIIGDKILFMSSFSVSV